MVRVELVKSRPVVVQLASELMPVMAVAPVPVRWWRWRLRVVRSPKFPRGWHEIGAMDMTGDETVTVSADTLDAALTCLQTCADDRHEPVRYRERYQQAHDELAAARQPGD